MSYQLFLLLLGTNVKTSFRCYFILLFIDNFFNVFHRTFICMGVLVQRLHSFIYSLRGCYDVMTSLCCNDYFIIIFVRPPYTQVL